MRIAAKESEILRACLDLLAAKRIWAMRMNCGAMKTAKGFVRFGRPGMADILALVSIAYKSFITGALVNTMIIPLWIECKAEDGRQSEEQKAFQQDVTDNGHIYLLARSSDDLENWLRERGA